MKIDVVRARIRLTLAVVITAVAVAAVVAALRELRRGRTDETHQLSPVGAPARLGGRHVAESE